MLELNIKLRKGDSHNEESSHSQQSQAFEPFEIYVQSPRLKSSKDPSSQARHKEQGTFSFIKIR